MDMTPAGVQELVQQGHEVLIEHLAGNVMGLNDELYEQAGVTVINSAKSIHDRAELIVKVRASATRKTMAETRANFIYLSSFSS